MSGLEEPIYDDSLKMTVERTDATEVVKWDTARINGLLKKQATVDAKADALFTEAAQKEDAKFRRGSAEK